MPPFRSPRIRARAVDAAAAALIVAVALVPFPDQGFRPHGALVAVSLVAVVVVPLRRRHPLAALAIALGCAAVSAAAGVVAPAPLVATMVAAFATAAHVRRPGGLIAAATAVLVVFATNAVARGGELFDSSAGQFVLLVGLAAALGEAARSRREYAAAMLERAERAERGREAEARRRVSEERVRIARDLHDIVAHQISVISLHAGVASSSLTARPDRAREALATIRGASRSVLADIGGLMTVLRDDPGADLDPGAALEPRAGLADADAEVARFVAAGLVVSVRSYGDVGVLSPATDHVALLVLREGLTNALKHGDESRAEVVIDADADGVALAIRNPVAPTVRPAASTGYGLIGLRERVAAARGRIETQRAATTFRLAVRLPAEVRS